MKEIILITGGTNGLGMALVKHLSVKGQELQLIIHGRNVEKGQKTLNEIHKINNKVKIDYFNADFTKLDDVVRMCDSIKKSYPKIDLLINNAGIATNNSFQLSNDGFEVISQVNFVAHYLVTHLLINHLKQAGNGKLIFVTSSAYNNDFHSVFNSRETWTALNAYRLSKFAMNCFMHNLSINPECSDITISAIHPGSRMRTGMCESEEYGDSIEVGTSNIINILGMSYSSLNGKYIYKDSERRLSNKVMALSEWTQIVAQLLGSQIIVDNCNLKQLKMI
jgi:NAD(P)-dependent dehydrogenase (short-subunit alcohol dehydrogenase family)